MTDVAIQPRGPAAAIVRTRPGWADDIALAYESGAASQFVLHGNVGDRFQLPSEGKPESGTLADYLAKVLLTRFDVVLSYDLGNGLRIVRGGAVLADWPHFKQDATLPAEPRAAVAWLTQYFRYTANLARLGQRRLQIACILPAAQLLAPATQGWSSYDIAAIALQIRDWASDGLLAGHSLATFLVTEALADLHPLIATNPRAQVTPIPLPGPVELQAAFAQLAAECPTALATWAADLSKPAAALAGTTIAAVDALVRTHEHRRTALTEKDLSAAKKRMVEQDCAGLIEFIDSKRTLDDLAGMTRVKEWLRQDLALWRKDDLQAMPMGYLLCGPVGTGKTFAVECLAGEAGVPVVKLKNFRDKWVGSTEGNLEKIFRLVRALGRCYVFVDEADQALGRRESGGNDGGIGGRIYAMLAQEMSETKNRGRTIWLLASSRPDLIEVDLKRPGRIDIKIPLLPTGTPVESWALIRALCSRRGLELPAEMPAALAEKIPVWLTPGAAEALAVKTYRVHRTANLVPVEALTTCLADWRPPVPLEVMRAQIDLAVNETSDAAFVPPEFRR